MSPERIIRKKIGELLIERNVITEEQLKIALEEQKKKGGYISQHLISLGLATEFDITSCLASQYGFPYLPLKNYNIAVDMLDIIPLKLIKVYSILPIDKIGKILSVAMADPLNDGVIELLKQITNCEVEVFISTYSELNAMIEKYFGVKLRKIDRNILDEKDLLRQNITQPFIQTIGYQGPERRRYRRVDVELEMNFILQGKSFKAKINNISFGGIFFIANSFIPIDTDILCKIYLETPIDAVVQVVRVEKIIDKFDIAGLFSFLTDDDRNTLVELIKKK